jgi:hypothetical protein
VIGVDVHVGAGEEREHFGVGPDRRVRSERAPREVRCLPKVGGGRVDRQIGPQGVHGLFAMQAMAGGEGQQLHELGASPVAPGLVGHGVAVHDDMEPPQQADVAGPRHLRRHLSPRLATG